MRKDNLGSIHPQGWVPIETATLVGDGIPSASSGSIHPQGWVPIETQPTAAGFGIDERYQ